MINLIKQGNSLVITSDQDFPFESGKIIVPQNSLTYVIDESDIVCFRSVSNYDILFTGLLKDITINGTPATKDNIIQLFDAVGNAPMGGGSITGDVYTKEEIDNKHFLTKIVLTQQEYDQLTSIDPDVIYVISDAPDIDNVFDATPLYTAYLSESKEVTIEFKDDILNAIPKKKVMVIHTSGDTATSDNNMVVNAASSELLTEFTGIFNDNLVAFTLDKNTNKVDMVVTPIGGAKSTKYINDEGASIFDLTTESTNAQIKTAFSSTDGVKIPEVGDEIIVNDIDNNIVNSGIVVSKTKNNDDYEIIIHSNNIVSGFISIDSMTVYSNESQGVDSLRIKRAEHSSINPALITEEAISALTGQVQNAATQTWVTEQINAAIANVNVKITEINNKI